MFDLNLDKNFELQVVNGTPNTNYSPLIEEWLFIKRLIERSEIHYEKNKMFDEIFDYSLYLGQEDEEVEDIVTEKLYEFYEKKVENIRKILLIEVFKTKGNFFVFYRHKNGSKPLMDDDTPYKIYF